MAADDKQTGNALRINGHYSIYRNGELVSRTPYSILDYISDDYPAITLDDWQYHTTQHATERANALIAGIENKCSNFKVINDIIKFGSVCNGDEEEDDFMIGQIIEYGGKADSWDPEKWLECNGAQLPVAGYQDLYDVIGRQFTEDDIPADYFNLPNFRGRVPVGFNVNSPNTPRTAPAGLLKIPEENYGRIGNMGGLVGVILNITQLAKHAHKMWLVHSGTRFTGGGSANALNDAGMEDGTPTDYAGSDYPHENRQPYLVVYKLIRYK
jgi:microcystin-dependent protein